MVLSVLSVTPEKKRGGFVTGGIHFEFGVTKNLVINILMFNVLILIPDPRLFFVYRKIQLCIKPVPAGTYGYCPHI